MNHILNRFDMTELMNNWGYTTWKMVGFDPDDLGENRTFTLDLLLEMGPDAEPEVQLLFLDEKGNNLHQSEPVDVKDLKDRKFKAPKGAVEMVVLLRDKNKEKEQIIFLTGVEVKVSQPEDEEKTLVKTSELSLLSVEPPVEALKPDDTSPQKKMTNP